VLRARRVDGLALMIFDLVSRMFMKRAVLKFLFRARPQSAILLRLEHSASIAARTAWTGGYGHRRWDFPCPALSASGESMGLVGRIAHRVRATRAFQPQ
jgi:hypothetical protein